MAKENKFDVKNLPTIITFTMEGKNNVRCYWITKPFSRITCVNELPKLQIDGFKIVHNIIGIYKSPDADWKQLETKILSAIQQAISDAKNYTQNTDYVNAEFEFLCDQPQKNGNSYFSLDKVSA